MKKVLTLLLVFVFALSVPAFAHVPDIKVEKFKIEKSIEKTDLVSVESKVTVLAVITDNKEPEKEFVNLNRFNQESCSFNSEVMFTYPNQFCKNSYCEKLPDKIT